MQKNDSIGAIIFKSLSLSKKELELIDSKFKREEYAKGAVVLDVGEVVYYQHYVHSGCLRAYFLDDIGKKHTMQFAVKDWWLSDYTAYYFTSKSIMVVECLQDATVFKISKKEMDELFAKIPQLEPFFRKKLEIVFASLLKRILSTSVQNTKQRYLDFVKKYPSIIKCVKNYHIASYLGVTSETLSRVRKEIAEN